MLSAAARAKPSNAFAVPLHTTLFFELPSRRQLGRADMGSRGGRGGAVRGGTREPGLHFSGKRPGGQQSEPDVFGAVLVP